MAAYTRDLVIIGTGPAGMSAAFRAAQLGMRVAIVEKDEIGGAWLRQGFVPEKVMLRSASVMDSIAEAASLAVKTGASSVSPERLVERSQTTIDRLAKSLEFNFKKFKIDVFKGRAHVTNPQSILIEPQKIVEAERILIATGRHFSEVPGFKLDGKNVISFHELNEVKALPRTVVIIGGGVRGVEFAYLYKALGVEVTILEEKKSLLSDLDPELGQETERIFRKRKINVLCGCRAARAEVKEGTVRVVYQDKQNADKEVFAVQVFVTLGRKPVTEGLGLEAAGVKLVNGYIEVNEKFETNVPSIYAVGDVTDKNRFPDAAWEAGRAAAEIMASVRLTGNEPIYVPRVVHTRPEIASVGISEQEAVDKKITHKVGRGLYRNSAKAVVDGNEDGFVKVIVDRVGKIIGAQILGENAASLISEFTLLMTAGLTVADAIKVLRPHPGYAEAVLEALLSSQSKGI
jgi:dihydrolipoamide dehydrogenase